MRESIKEPNEVKPLLFFILRLLFKHSLLTWWIGIINGYFSMWLLCCQVCGEYLTVYLTGSFKRFAMGFMEGRREQNLQLFISILISGAMNPSCAHVLSHTFEWIKFSISQLATSQQGSVSEKPRENGVSLETRALDYRNLWSPQAMTSVPLQKQWSRLPAVLSGSREHICSVCYMPDNNEMAIISDAVCSLKGSGTGLDGEQCGAGISREWND